MDNVKESPSYTPAELAAFSQEVRHPHSINESSIDADTAVGVSSKQERAGSTHNTDLQFHSDSPRFPN
jgi:hypothetical protein